MSKGYESLVNKVKIDCDEGEGCFNPNGCDQKFRRSIKCSHKYCDKFKWIIDRAKHYAEKTGLNWEDILDSWEEDCNYWYMNYYQEAKQPLIKGDNVKVFDSVEDMMKSIKEYKFRCPACGGISTDPYECNSGVISDGNPCDWKVYGLFGDLGKGAYVYCKDKLKGENIFMPLAWENKEK